MQTLLFVDGSVNNVLLKSPDQSRLQPVDS